MLTINGESVEAAGLTIADYLDRAGYNAQRVVVEVNLTIVSRPLWQTTVLQDGDKVEILNFVGGG
jgi:sulfur carrier protein